MRSSCVALSKIELIQAHKEDDTKRKKVRAMNKMTVAAALAALAVGAAAGWFAARAWGGAEVSSKPPYHDDASPACNNGMAGSPLPAAKPQRKALIRSSADAEVQKRILENKISYLEKCIAAAKGVDAKPAEKKCETNAEIVERLMKLPTENERWTALSRLDRKTNMSFTLGEMKRLCPEHTAIDEPKCLDNLDKITGFSARRIGVLGAFDLSGLNDEERKVHAEYMEVLAELPDLYANMIDQNDSMTMGEVWERIQRVISIGERCANLHKKENDMLFSQMVKSFEVPDADAIELRATFDEVRDVTSSGYFEKKD